MKLALILSAVLLSGCAFDGLLLDNRVACSVAKDKAFFVSEYGPVGISAKIADADRAVICK